MIETNQLYLLPCKLEHLEALLQSRHSLATLLEVQIPEEWPYFPEAIPFIYQLLKENENNSHYNLITSWNMYFFIHKQERCLVGSGGFKGIPDENGIVEIGYEVVAKYQSRGLATEAAQGLINYAFSSGKVSIVQAHTLAEDNASTKVLQKVGMVKIKTIADEENGAIWLWQIAKQ